MESSLNDLNSSLWGLVYCTHRRWTQIHPHHHRHNNHRHHRCHHHRCHHHHRHHHHHCHHHHIGRCLRLGRGWNLHCLRRHLLLEPAGGKQSCCQFPISDQIISRFFPKNTTIFNLCKFDASDRNSFLNFAQKTILSSATSWRNPHYDIADKSLFWLYKMYCCKFHIF